MVASPSRPHEGPVAGGFQGTWKGKGEVATSVPDPKSKEQGGHPRAETGRIGEREGPRSPPLSGVLVPGCCVRQSRERIQRGGYCSEPSLSRERNVYGAKYHDIIGALCAP